MLRAAEGERVNLWLLLFWRFLLRRPFFAQRALRLCFLAQLSCKWLR